MAFLRVVLLFLQPTRYRYEELAPLAHLPLVAVVHVLASLLARPVAKLLQVLPTQLLALLGPLVLMLVPMHWHLRRKRLGRMHPSSLDCLLRLSRESSRIHHRLLPSLLTALSLTTRLHKLMTPHVVQAVHSVVAFQPPCSETVRQERFSLVRSGVLVVPLLVVVCAPHVVMRASEETTEERHLCDVSIALDALPPPHQLTLLVMPLALGLHEVFQRLASLEWIWWAL